jgi:predicted permease
MALDIPSTLLYIFLAMLQIIILFSVGIITGMKKMWTPKSIKTISELLYNKFIPIFAIIELGRTASWPNIEIMWILMISVTVSMLLGFALGVLIHRLFGLDVRFTWSYPYLISMPSLGTLPLVLGRALCLPGGMLEGDPQCPNILGFMVMNKLIFNILLFALGFLLIPKDANLTNLLMEKMNYVWHNLIGKVYDKNFAVLNIFLSFMKDEKTAKKLFEVFEKKYKLKVTDKENLFFNYEFIENPEIQLEFYLDVPHLAYHIENNCKHIESEEKLKAENQFIKEKVLLKDKIEDSFFEKSINKSHITSKIFDNDFDIIGNSINFIENELEPETLPNYKSEAFNAEAVFLTEKDYLSYVKEIKDISGMNININIPNTSSIKQIKEKSLEEEKGSELHFPSQMNYMLEEYINAEYSLAENPPEKMSVAEEKKIIDHIKLKRESSVKIFAADVERYYQKVFGFVEKHFNEQKATEYNEFKLTTMKSIFDFPPKFPVARNITITNNVVKVIEEEWIKLEKMMKKINPDFKLITVKYSLSLMLILKEFHSPPIVSHILGLIIGMSGLREIMFSSNHYISNLLDGLNIMVLPTVPLLYLALGIFMISVKNVNRLNTPLSKRYLVLSFVHRLIIMPAIGLLYVYLWETYFGGIVAASKVFRISVFIPWCLPCAVTAVVIINMVKFFTEETGIILFAHNSSIIVTLTILYSVYYVVIG